MKKLFYYYEEDAEKKAEEIANEGNLSIRHCSYDKIYDCEPMDEKAERLLDNSVSGESGAFYVGDDAVIVYWTDKECDLKRNSLDELANYINDSEDFPSDVEDIIEYNGWESITGEEFGIAIDHKNNEKLIIGDNGDAKVVEYK